MVQAVNRVFLSLSVNIFQISLQAHLYLFATIIRTTCGQSLGTLKQGSVWRVCWYIGYKSTFTLFTFQSPEVEVKLLPNGIRGSVRIYNAYIMRIIYMQV